MVKTAVDAQLKAHLGFANGITNCLKRNTIITITQWWWIDNLQSIIIINQLSNTDALTLILD